MFGLGDEVGRDPGGVGRRRGEDHALRRAGREVDPDLAADLDLGRGDPGVAGPDDTVHWGDARVGEAVGEGTDRLCAAGDDERVDLEQAGGAEEDGVERTVAVGRRRDDDPLDARDSSRDDGHDQRRRIGSRTAWDVGADRGQWRPAAFDVDARGDGRAGRCRALSLGEAADVVDRLVERTADARLERVPRPGEVVGVEDEAAIETSATDLGIRLADGVVAAGPDVGERRANRLADARIRDRAAPDEGFVVAACGRIAGGDRGEIQPRDGERLGRHGRAHGTIFSIGRTRMPEAPAPLRRGRRLQTSSAPTTEWMAIIPEWASGMTVGDSRAGSSAWRSSRQAAGAFIIRYLRPRAAMTALSIVSIAASAVRALGRGGGVGDQDRLGCEDIADLAEAVHRERGAGRNEVDDPLGEAEPWRDLDGARDRDDLDIDAAIGEEPTRRVRMSGRDAQAGEVVDGGQLRVVRDCRGETAAAVAEGPDLRQVGAGLAQEVEPGDPEVCDAVADELDDIVGPDEQDVELVVLDEGDKAPVVLLEHEARVMEQAQGRFDHPALVRDGESQATAHRSPAIG